jgi:hypothetical protein
MQLQVKKDQQTELLAVLTPEELEGMKHPALKFDPVAYATSSFELWHRDNQQFIDPVAAYCSARRSAIALLKSVPETSMALLRVSEGCCPLKQAAKWRAFRAAR